MLSLLTTLFFVIAPPAPSDTAHLVVVAMTDVHGHVTDWDYAHNRPYAGGLVRVATIVDSLRAKYPGQVIVADNGDLIQGDPFATYFDPVAPRGADTGAFLQADPFATYFHRVAPREPDPVVEAMGLIGCDVATFGTYEFAAW